MIVEPLPIETIRAMDTDTKIVYIILLQEIKILNEAVQNLQARVTTLEAK